MLKVNQLPWMCPWTLAMSPSRTLVVSPEPPARTSTLPILVAVLVTSVSSFSKLFRPLISVLVLTRSVRVPVETLERARPACALSV